METKKRKSSINDIENSNSILSKMKKLNSGSYGNIYTDENKAFKVSSFCLEKGGIPPEVLNDIIYLKGLKYHNSFNSLDMVEFTKVLDKITIQIMMPLAKQDLFYFIRDHTLIERGNWWDLMVNNVLVGMDYLYNNNICHLDIKPANILWFGDSFKINDFNLTRRIESLCEDKYYAMTDCYRPPEIIINSDYRNSYPDWKVDILSDMWSLGATFYEYITGKILFNVEGNNHLLKEFYIYLTETDDMREKYSARSFLDKISNKEFSYKFNLVELDGYVDKMNISREWINIIISMMSINPRERPKPIEILSSMNCLEDNYVKYEITKNNERFDKWETFDFLEDFMFKIPRNTKISIFERLLFMTKNKYNYGSLYDKMYIWRNMWLYFRDNTEYEDSFLTSINMDKTTFFLDIFNIFDRYARLLPEEPLSINEYELILEAIAGLIFKLRKFKHRPHHVRDNRFLYYKFELDIIKKLDFDLPILGCSQFVKDKINNLEFDFNKYFETDN